VISGFDCMRIRSASILIKFNNIKWVSLDSSQNIFLHTYLEQQLLILFSINLIEFKIIWVWPDLKVYSFWEEGSNILTLQHTVEHHVLREYPVKQSFGFDRHSVVVSPHFRAAEYALRVLQRLFCSVCSVPVVVTMFVVVNVPSKIKSIRTCRC
jgi:hypothetical protein